MCGHPTRLVKILTIFPGLATAALSFSASALGQDPESRSEPAAELEEIVVTARRKAENIRTVPISITAVTNDEIRRLDLRSATDLQRIVPSLTATGRLGQNEESLTLRGQRATGEFIGAGAGSAVVSYFAEVPGASTGPGLYLDLANVQVLKGPQGTLFGRNTTGGAILYEPMRPEGEFSAYVQTTLGDMNRLDVETVFNLPIVRDVLLLRVAAQHQKRDGLAVDVNTGAEYNNRDHWTARLGIQFNPTERVSNYFIFQSVRFEENGPASILYAVNPQALLFPLLQPLFSAQQERGIRRVALGVNNSESRDTRVLVNRTEVSLGNETGLTNVLSYTREKGNRSGDLDGTTLAVVDSLGVTGFGSGSNPNHSILTEELQLSGNFVDGNGEWRLGAYLERLRTEGTQTFSQRLFLAQSTHQLDAPQSVDSEALFGHVNLDLGVLSESLQGLNLSAGYRYTWDAGLLGFDLLVYPGQLFQLNQIPDPAPGDLCFTFLATGATHPNCLVEVDGSDSGQSWNLGLDYQLEDGSLVYGSYRRGYKSGGFNPGVGVFFGTTVPEFSFGPEEVDVIEFGWKGAWPLGDLQFRQNAAFYKSWYSDVQVLNNVVIAGAATTATQNAARAEIEGIEVESEIQLAESLSFTFAYAYTRANYKDYVTPAGEDLSGLPFLYTPRRKFSLGLSFETDLPDQLGELALYGTYAWQAEMFGGFTTADVPGTTIPSYGLAGLRVDWNRIFGTRLDLALFVNNLNDQEYRIANNAQYESLGYAITQYGEPRIWAVSLRFDF